MAWNHTKQNQKGRKSKQQKVAKKIAKKVFGQNLALVMVLLLLLGVAFWLCYQQFQPVRDFVDGLGIFTTSTTTAPRPVIDPNGELLAVHYIDVGQGDSTLLQTSAGSVLIDCSEPEYGEDIVAYLNSQGVTELEYFIITHPDEDHMGAAAYIIRNITVKKVIMNGQTKNAKFFSNTLDAMEERGVDGEILGPGDYLEIGALRLDVFGPYSLDHSTAEWNNASLIIKAIYGETSFLFTGDAEESGEEDLLEHHRAELDCDVFQAGHHGSKTSNSEELLDAATPSHVVISCGEGNKYGHPHQVALDRFEGIGAQVHRTDKEGTIVFISDGKSVSKN